MPLDSTIPQETKVSARQIGGKPLAADSALWRVLFPAETLRIDGRVPVENSSKFLLQTRLNPARELVAAAFTPADEASRSAFKTLSDYLIAKKYVVYSSYSYNVVSDQPSVDMAWSSHGATSLKTAHQAKSCTWCRFGRQIDCPSFLKCWMTSNCHNLGRVMSWWACG